jgi:hypothetical protein
VAPFIPWSELPAGAAATADDEPAGAADAAGALADEAAGAAAAAEVAGAADAAEELAGALPFLPPGFCAWATSE